ncbi:hypothetical protein IGL98_001394 [Enterococcus sp. DIV0840]|uniref:Uncharacterized protein n=1 Tax=Candidatus Enterococcus mansonii TaxID=1834181 RepID=A0ABU8IJD0_9ENTE
MLSNYCGFYYKICYNDINKCVKFFDLIDFEEIENEKISRNNT